MTDVTEATAAAVEIYDEKLVNIKVIIRLENFFLDDDELDFQITEDSPLKDLMEFYAQRTGLPTCHLRFYFNGKRLTYDMTPKSLDMEDDDIIEVFKEEVCGSASS